MERKELINRQRNLLRYLSLMPRRILTLQDSGNIPEFVLYDLCCEDCFDLSKAAFFVDNPDFDCLIGVTGVNKDEGRFNNPWIKPEEFVSFMDKSSFNQKVRNLTMPSQKIHTTDDLVKKISEALDIKSPISLSWTMKHGNQGLLLFENKEKENWVNEQLENGVHLLGFCPIF